MVSVFFYYFKQQLKQQTTTVELLKLTTPKIFDKGINLAKGNRYQGIAISRDGGYGLYRLSSSIPNVQKGVQVSANCI